MAQSHLPYCQEYSGSIPLLRTFTSLSPDLGRDGPPGSENHARRSLYSGVSLDPFGAPASEAKLKARRPMARVRPPLLIMKNRGSEGLGSSHSD